MTEFGLLREAGAVAFTDGRHTIASSMVMRRALTYARDFGAVIAHETQDRDLGGVRRDERGPVRQLARSARHSARGGDHPAGARPGARAADPRRLPRRENLDRDGGKPPWTRAKADGAKVTAGVSINSLSLNENDVGEYRTFFRLAPPLARRGRPHRHDRGVEATAQSTSIVSSHDPQDVDTKRLPFADAAVGAIGLETLLAVALAPAPQWRSAAAAHHRCTFDCACKAVRPAGRHAEARFDCRFGACRSWRAVAGARGRHPLALQEHLLRRREAARQGLENLGRRTHSVFGLIGQGGDHRP
jgi:hypothetical protein